MKPVLSICIPTNGVAKWVFPVLDSIYQDDVSTDLYEVVITDNGKDEEFKNQMQVYVQKYPNIVYDRTEAFEFLNEIEAYKRAKGELIKFINHRTKFLEGTLRYLVDFAEKNKEEKPIIYFANGVLEDVINVEEYETFDMFVEKLSYYSSWSTGMCFWREDFDRIPKDAVYNTLFPHTTILFNETKRNRYIIDNNVLLFEIPTGTTPKGRYNLFYAFAVEYPAIILDLARSELISMNTFEKVAEKNFKFVCDLYLEYVYMKHECSYDLSNHEQSIEVFYSMKKMHKKNRVKYIKHNLRKVLGK